MGIRLMIIKLRRYNEIRALLIEDGDTGFQAQVSYQNRAREASVTRVAVCMGVNGTGMQTGYRGACNQPLGWDPDLGRVRTLRSKIRSISML